MCTLSSASVALLYRCVHGCDDEAVQQMVRLLLYVWLIAAPTLLRNMLATFCRQTHCHRHRRFPLVTPFNTHMLAVLACATDANKVHDNCCLLTCQPDAAVGEAERQLPTTCLSTQLLEVLLKCSLEPAGEAVLCLPCRPSPAAMLPGAADSDSHLGAMWQMLCRQCWLTCNAYVITAAAARAEMAALASAVQVVMRGRWPPT
jgi:hypothetical protein